MRSSFNPNMDQEEVRMNMLSNSIIAAVKNSQTNRNHQDLTIVCEGGLLVQSNTALLATISQRMGELFNSLTTFPEVVIMPDIKFAPASYLDIFRKTSCLAPLHCFSFIQKLSLKLLTLFLFS